MLKDKAKKMNSGNGIMFMEDRDKGNIKDLYEGPVVVRDYDFIHGEDGDYLVFICDGDDKNFFFGGSVMTKNFKGFTPEEKNEVQRDGLPIQIYERKSKKGRVYQAVEFYPEDDEIKF